MHPNPSADATRLNEAMREQAGAGAIQPLRMDGAVALESADGALDGVALFVGFAVERWGPPTAAGLRFSVAPLVFPVRDDRLIPRFRR